jgi:ABC-2 type transport system ATP-binding protein
MVHTVLGTTALSRRFGPVQAVRNLSIAVPEASVYGFLGPNGAGKTTTIRLVLGLIRADAGEVTIFGSHPRGSERAKTLGRVGALVETPSFYAHLSGRDNLRICAKLIGARPAAIDRVLSTMDLQGAAARPVRDYSLGMKQRLGIAMALLGEPALLILDEPTNGLDPAGISETRDFIRRLPAEQGITVFLSSHLLGEVERIATHVGIIDHGRLLFEGALADLGRHIAARLEIETDDRARARALLEGAGIAVSDAVDGRLTLPIGDAGEAARINSLLVRSGLAVSHLALRKPSLEELFLAFTGNGSFTEAA